MQKCTNTVIEFNTRSCSLGFILVAKSARGVCAISLGDDPKTLILALQTHFPHAMPINDNGELNQMITQLIDHLDAPQNALTLPLDVRGTIFQQRVWQVLQTIPSGATMSYSQVAQHIGHPKATRAVAKACAANHLAVAIPCHRVIKSNGDVSGYRWGIARKAALLRRESTQ